MVAIRIYLPSGTDRIHMLFTAVAVAAQGVQNGLLKCLATSSGERVALMPSVPTLREAGLEGKPFLLWNALFVPASTPEHIVESLNKALNTALKDPATAQSLKNLGLDVTPGSRDDLARYMKEDLDRIRQVVADAGLQSTD